LCHDIKVREGRQANFAKSGKRSDHPLMHRHHSGPLPQDERPLLYLEDVQVGQRFTTGTYVMEAAEIQAFAAQFDPQPFHLSDDAAKNSLFGGLAASGWHTAAVSMRLQVTSGPRLAGGVIGAGCDIAWPRPTRAGDVLRVDSEVLTVRASQSRPERGILALRSETRNQRDEIVQRMVANLVILRRP
jgi:acyl dehydratase